MLHNSSRDNSLSSFVFLICLAASLCFHLALFLLAWALSLFTVQRPVPPRIHVTVGLSSVASRAAPEVVFMSDKPLVETKVFPPRTADSKQDKTPEAATPQLRNLEKPVQKETEPGPTETKPVSSETKAKRAVPARRS